MVVDLGQAANRDAGAVSPAGEGVRIEGCRSMGFNKLWKRCKRLTLRHSNPLSDMASVLTHAFTAVALTRIVSAEKRDRRFWVLLGGSAVLPDADVIGFAFGIDYGDLLGHRGLSHSLLFAAAWSLVVVLREYRRVEKGSKELKTPATS